MDDEKKKPQQQKKEQLPKKTDEELDQEAKEQLHKWMEQLEEQGLPKTKVIKLKIPKRTLKYVLLETIITIVVNVILFLSLTGFFEWAFYQSILDLTYFALIFSGIEIILKNSVHLFFRKIVIKTFGFILVIPPFIALPLSLFLASGWVQINSLGLLIVCFAILLLVRSVFQNILINLPRRK